MFDQVNAVTQGYPMWALCVPSGETGDSPDDGPADGPPWVSAVVGWSRDALSTNWSALLAPLEDVNASTRAYFGTVTYFTSWPAAMAALAEAEKAYADRTSATESGEQASGAVPGA